MNIGTSSLHVVLNVIKWFILVTFKSNISKNEVHENGYPRHSLPMYCGRYIRIMSENSHVCLSKNNRSQLMDLASACIDRRVITFLDSKMNWWSGEISVFNQSVSVHLQTQMPLIALNCGMK